MPDPGGTSEAAVAVTPSHRTVLASAAAVALATFVLRIWGVTEYSLVLRDQYRDWEIALGPFTDLPLLGPATHVGGYTLGPGFYWILWAIRVVLGPWFENLPHAGGIGQAALQSFVDGVLLVGVWRRTGSTWPAFATVMLVATSGFDMSFAATIWNPVVGAVLAKLGIALLLLDWPHRGPWRMAATMAVAWLAVHAYTGAVYVAAAVFFAIVAEPLVRRRVRESLAALGIAAATIFVLQIPYLWFQLSNRFRVAAMGAVTESLVRIASGSAAPELTKSVRGLLDAFTWIQIQPFASPGAGVAAAAGVVLFAAAMVVAIRFRHDITILSVTLLPLLLSIVGYSLFLGALDAYYYLSLATPVVLTLVLAATSPWPAHVARGVGMMLCVAALLLVPQRFQFSTTVNRMPQYRPLVKGSRVLVHRLMPLRAVRTTFALPPSGDPEVIFRFLGGQIDRKARWMAVIDENGNVTYKDLGGA